MLNFLPTIIMLQLRKNENILKPTKLRGFGHLWKLKQQDHQEKAIVRYWLVLWGGVRIAL